MRNRPNSQRPDANGPADRVTLSNMLNGLRLAFSLMSRAERAEWRRQWAGHCAFFARMAAKKGGA